MTDNSVKPYIARAIEKSNSDAVRGMHFNHRSFEVPRHQISKVRDLVRKDIQDANPVLKFDANISESPVRDTTTALIAATQRIARKQIKAAGLRNKRARDKVREKVSNFETRAADEPEKPESGGGSGGIQVRRGGLAVVSEKLLGGGAAAVGKSDIMSFAKNTAVYTLGDYILDFEAVRNITEGLPLDPSVRDSSLRILVSTFLKALVNQTRPTAGDLVAQTIVEGADRAIGFATTQY